MNVAIYCRVSTEDQADRGTIESQIEFAAKYCDLHNYNIVEWYKEDGVSGKYHLGERPEGKRLLEDAKNKKFESVFVYKLNRIGRVARIILNSVYDIESYGISVKSMTEPFDTSNPAGRFMLTMLAGVADYDRETILQNTWLGSNRCARQGQWLGGIVPYGYYVTDEKFLAISDTPLPNSIMSEADVIRMIYKMIAQDKMSTIKVADHLNALAIPPSYVKDGRLVLKGKRKQNTSGIWLPGRVRNMIVNETYKGIHRYGKRSSKPNREIIERKVPAVVSEEIWDLAQVVLHDNQLEATRNSKHNYLLRGLIKCGSCSLTYCGTYFNRHKRYYVCNGKINYRGPLQGKCHSKNIPAEWIEEIVWSDCVKFIKAPTKTVRLIHQSKADREVKKTNISREMEIIKSAIESKVAEKQSILDLFRKELISFSDVEIQLQKINDENSVLVERLSSLQCGLEDKESSNNHLEDAKTYLEDLNNKIKNGNPSFEEKREIIKTLVDKIVIDTTFNDQEKPIAKVTIHYIFNKCVSRRGRDSSRQSA